MWQVIEDSRCDASDFTNRQYAARPYYESDAEEVVPDHNNPGYPAVERSRPQSMCRAGKVHRDLCEDLHEQLMSYGLSPPEACPFPVSLPTLFPPQSAITTRRPQIPLPWPLWSRVAVERTEYSNMPSEASKAVTLAEKAFDATNSMGDNAY